MKTTKILCALTFVLAAICICDASEMTVDSVIEKLLNKIKLQQEANSQERVRVPWTSAQVLLESAADGDKESLEMLRTLYKLKPTGDKLISDTLATKQIGHTVAGPDLTHLRTWFAAVRTFLGDATRDYPRVHIRGAGPTGLATALYARREGIKTITVVNDYKKYYRHHIVRTMPDANKANSQITLPNKDGMQLDSPEVEGMEQLLLGLGLSPPGTAAAALTAIDNAFPWGAGGIIRQIPVDVLEKFLFVVGSMVGINFEYDKEADVDKKAVTRNVILTAVVGEIPVVPAPPAPGAPVVPFAPPQENFPLADVADPVPATQEYEEVMLERYDVFVGAEGTKSPTRQSKFFKPTGGASPVFVVPKCYSDDHPFANLQPLEQASNHLRAIGGPVVAGFVYTGACILPAGHAVGAPAGWNLNIQERVAFRSNYYIKQLTPPGGVPTACLLELYLKPHYGRLLKRAFSASGGGFNFNLDGAKKLNTDGLRNQIKLMYRILERLFAAAAGAGVVAGHIDNVGQASALNILQNMREFKLYQNSLRMTVAAANENTIHPSAYVGNVYRMAGTNEPKLFALVGDAIREALPDTGMGVNDGHHTALKLAELTLRPLAALTRPEEPVRENPKVGGEKSIKKKQGQIDEVDKAYDTAKSKYDQDMLVFVPAAATAMGAYQTAIGEHEKNIACGLQWHLVDAGAAGATNFYQAFGGVLPGGPVLNAAGVNAFCPALNYNGPANALQYTYV